jgi:hypothetical protein
VIEVPRSFKEIIEHADELSARLHEFEARADDVKDARSLRELRRAVLDRAAAEAYVAELVTVARGEGHAWSAIGAMLGTSGEAARQRYGGEVEAPSEPGGSGSAKEATKAPRKGKKKSSKRARLGGR